MSSDHFTVPWGESMSPGVGYKLAEGKHAPRSAIVWPSHKKPPVVSSSRPVDIDDTSSPVLFYRMVKSAADIEDLISVGATASFHGWGGSVNASASMSKELKVSQENIVVVLGWHYTTGMIWHALRADGISLRDDAKELLRKKGPAEFAALYGDSYVAGAKMGGSLYADYTMSFQSVTDKLSVKAAVEAAYQSYFSAGGSVSFESELAKSNIKVVAATNVRAQGFTGALPPSNQTLDDLYSLRESFDLRKGVPLVAGLRSYAEVPGYLEALNQFMADKKISTSLAAPLPTQGVIKRVNKNFFRLCYLYNTLKDLELDTSDEDDARLGIIRDQIRQLTGEGTGGAFTVLDNPDNMRKLVTYDKYCTYGTDPQLENKTLYDQGKRLFDKLLVAEDFEEEVNEILARKFPVWQEGQWESTKCGALVDFAPPIKVLEGTSAKFGNKPITRVIAYYGKEPGRPYLSKIELHFGSGSDKQVFTAGRDNAFGMTSQTLDLRPGAVDVPETDADGLEIKPNEYVSKVDVRWGHAINGLTFTTSSGRTMQGGDNVGGGLSVMDGSKGREQNVKGARGMLVGIKVAESPNELTGGTYIGALKFIWRWSHPKTARQ